MSPTTRISTTQRFITEISQTPSCQQLLDAWGLHLEASALVTTGRRLEPQTVHFGSRQQQQQQQAAAAQPTSVQVGANGTFTQELSRQKVLVPAVLQRWLVLFQVRDDTVVRMFFQELRKHLDRIGCPVRREPEFVPLKSDSARDYHKAIVSKFASDLSLICVVFPFKRQDHYAAVKRLCCTERLVPTQCLWTKTIRQPKSMASVALNVAGQINVKLGGALWGISIPYQDFMVIGIDVYHADKRRLNSTLAVVASANPSCTQWYSRVAKQQQGQEISTSLRVLVQSQINNYLERTGTLPKVIYVYRDGVSDGEVEQVQRTEVQMLYKAASAFGEEYRPLIVFVILQKRIHQRIYLDDASGPANAPPGTVVDHTITKQRMLDFFLVPQNVNIGTVTPTHCITAHLDSAISIDEVQQLTYRMCHLYYNWAGAVRVPAPCQYAHKLAYMIGQFVQDLPHEAMCDRLFYL